MWGIPRRDRRWFQLLTLIGGIAGSAALTWLELAHGPAGNIPNPGMRNIILGIGASFIAAGFIAWGLLHSKEMLMAIADWIREATERRRRRLLAEGRAEGRVEGYDMGYDDAQQGKPRRRPTDKPESERPKADQTP